MGGVGRKEVEGGGGRWREVEREVKGKNHSTVPKEPMQTPELAAQTVSTSLLVHSESL